jgi:hypothetical protein
MTVSKNVHTQIITNCEYVYWHGRRDFANIIKIKDGHSESSGWAQPNH